MVDVLSVKAIPADIFPEWQGALSWHLDSFVERSSGANTYESIVESILDRSTQCWVVLDQDERVRACAMSYLADDAGKTCIILACAGEGFRDWFEMLAKTINLWSKEAGSNKFEIHARPGWERFLKEHLGMKKTHVVMEMPNVQS
jgi:hypothetical protein